MKNNDNIHAGHRKRLRNLVKDGDISKLQDYQLLELLLTYTIPRKDTNVIAHKLINKFGNLPNVLDTKPEFLMKVDGIGENSALFLNLIPKLFSEYKMRRLQKRIPLQTPDQILSFCLDLLEFKNVEEIYLIMLDDYFDLINYTKVATGTTNMAMTSTREITEIALKYNASYIILAHNHPYGIPTPSSMDDIFTKTIVMAMTLNGIEVLEHIIVGKNSSYYSYRNVGKITKMIEEVLIQQK